ncbi:hypothetical protein GA0070609_6466 [Micromonospora echinaurantiaca]|uniref:Uncharacterized protein n=1 Tax=Micromonospora echinaurantiaca TaxID=47857 RepID=A0A1C5KCK1_9ACTN|nr:DUF5994 family protein [Micromonospora echinaurantiaca]SCG80480.1 hypothetical protein GA0070609_6466 [Micromonospora echinaurantiaca]
MIRSTSDRMTWVCTGEPPTARLRLADPPSSRAMLDGGWWPTSRDPVVELCSLVTALTAQRGGVIERIMLDPAAWDRHPRRIGVGGAVVRVGWFTTLGTGLVIVTGRRDLRIDLTVTAPETTHDVAMAAMLAASSPASTTRAAGIPPTPQSPPSPRLARPEDDVDAWESEGGHLRFDRHPTAPVRT